MLIAVGLGALMVYGEVFRAHMPAFLFLWVFLPVVAWWLNTPRMRSQFPIAALKVFRGILLTVVVLISVASFSHYDRIRDAIGERYVEGYRVLLYEDTDDYGRPVRTGVVQTAHWYSKLALWLVEWLIVVACLALPFLTWFNATRAIKTASMQATAA
jgi:hypothetical protein